MIIRIVKMTFRPEEVEGFIENFHDNKRRIRAFEGCRRLELLRDLNDDKVFFTYSYWKSEEHLQSYRQSDLFRSVWERTKQRFAEKPQAWSVSREVELL